MRDFDVNVLQLAVNSHNIYFLEISRSANHDNLWVPIEDTYSSLHRPSHIKS